MEEAARRGDNVEYRTDSDLNLDEALELYRASTLGERRPIHNRRVMETMIHKADLIVSAWKSGQLVGIARTLTDFAYVAYLADLAVRADCQRQGIGRRLIEETRARLEPTCMMTLLAAPAAKDYYAKLGWEHNPRAWMLGPRERA